MKVIWKKHHPDDRWKNEDQAGGDQIPHQDRDSDDSVQSLSSSNISSSDGKDEDLEALLQIPDSDLNYQNGYLKQAILQLLVNEKIIT